MNNVKSDSLTKPNVNSHKLNKSSTPKGVDFLYPNF